MVNLNRLDHLVEQFITEAVFPACAVTVLHEGRAIINRCWGWVDPDEGRQFPVLHDTRFDLASVTKLFTTTAALSLIGRGAADLDTPLVAIIPEFGGPPRPLNGGQDPHSKELLPTPPELAAQTADPQQITLWHLLTHTSGLAPWRDVYNAAGPAPAPPTQPEPVPRDERWARALTALCAYPFVGQADGVVRYSDLGLMLLGEAVARLHGRPGRLDVALQELVLGPLNLTDVGFNPVRGGLPLAQTVPTELDPTWRKRRAWGEVHDENACGLGGVAGHAGLFAPARSVALLGQAWLDDPSVFGIPPELAAQATSEQAVTDDERRGLGWMLKSREDSSAGELFHPESYGHTGFTGTSLWVDPQARLMVSCLTNRVYPGRERPGIHAFRRALHDLIAEEVRR